MKNRKARTFLLAGAALLASGVWAQGQPVCLSTPETSLVIDAPQGGELKYVYYGAKLDDADLSQIDAVRTCNHAAYPVYVQSCRLSGVWDEYSRRSSSLGTSCRWEYVYSNGDRKRGYYES